MPQKMDQEFFSSQKFLNKLKKQDKDAVDKVVRAYHTQLFRACLGQRFSEEDSFEIVAGTWKSFFEAISKFEGRSHIRTFVFGILYNKMREARRANQKHQGDEIDDQVIERSFDHSGHWVKEPQDPESFTEGVQTMGVIEGCLEGLPDKYRMAFYLKEVQEEETPNILQMMQITQSNLGVLLFRAKLKLKECIEAKIPGLKS